MSTYWGIKSAMKNFNKTMKEVMDEFYRIGEHNWYKNWTSMNTNNFGKDSWGRSYEDYIQAFFYIKYLSETYGNQTAVQIVNATKQYINGTSVVSAKKAAETVIGKDFDQIMRDFYEWRVLNATANNQAPTYQPEVTLITSGLSDQTDNVTIKPTGALVEEITVLSDHNMTVTFNTNGTVMLTFLVHKKDGSVERFWTRWYANGTNADVVIDTVNVTHVQVLKSNPNDTASVQVNMTISNKGYRIIGIESNPWLFNLDTTYTGWCPQPTDTRCHAYNSDTYRWRRAGYWKPSSVFVNGKTYRVRLFQNPQIYGGGSYSNFRLYIICYNAYGLVYTTPLDVNNPSFDFTAQPGYNYGYAVDWNRYYGWYGIQTTEVPP